MSRHRVVVAAASLTATAALLAGCTYGGSGPPAPHYLQFNADQPHGNAVTVCSAHGCRHKTPFTFTHGDIATLADIMTGPGRQDTPAAEREALKSAIAWIEQRVGPATGTATDRAGLEIAGGGNPGQMDCVDEATNTTSYLTVLSANGLLRHHDVQRPMAKSALFMGRWPHYFAVIRDTTTGVRWAVDSFMYANGKPPIVMEADKWYIRS